MDIEIYFEPKFHIIIRDFLNKDINKSLLAEAIINKDKFVPSETFGGPNTAMRSNKVAFYDNIYSGRRSESQLLSSIDDFINSSLPGQMLSSSPYPLNLFNKTNHHETQLSRYGNSEQYLWHIDKLGSNDSRLVTMVYYFNKEPKKFKGGKLEITNSPIFQGKLLMKNAEVKTIDIENNMLIIFGSTTAHRVTTTEISSEEFEDGRFSSNCWIGII